MTTHAWIETSEDAGTLILRVCGELDTSSREVIEPAVMAVIPTAYKVVLDLGDLTFCDSRGLSMLVAINQRAEAEGTTLIVGNIPPNIARLFAIAGVDQIFNIAD